jgi:flavin-dependent dehydrogenase
LRYRIYVRVGRGPRVPVMNEDGSLHTFDRLTEATAEALRQVRGGPDRAEVWERDRQVVRVLRHKDGRITARVLVVGDGWD